MNYIKRFYPFRRHSFSVVTIICLLAIFVSSCKTVKESYYFNTLKNDTTLARYVSDTGESKIKVGDILSVSATSLNREEDVTFNQAAGEFNSLVNPGAGPGFLVGPDGTVLFHKLGNFKAAGFTRKEFALSLQKALLPYMKDPVVNVNYLNHKVTILGAVKAPQVITFSEEQLSLLDVIARSGDMLDNSKKNDVMVIREVNNEKKVKHINLEDHSIFNSPWYYVQPNDIVYVIPSNEKQELEEKRRRLQTSLSLVASGISLLIIILDRVIK